MMSTVKKMILRKRGKQINEQGVNPRLREGKNKIKFLTQLIRGRGSSKWSKTRGENYMGIKVHTSSGQIGVPLEKYSNNCVISPN